MSVNKLLHHVLILQQNICLAKKNSYDDSFIDIANLYDELNFVTLQ